MREVIAIFTIYYFNVEFSILYLFINYFRLEVWKFYYVVILERILFLCASKFIDINMIVFDFDLHKNN
jgi:hypothetical protein